VTFFIFKDSNFEYYLKGKLLRNEKCNYKAYTKKASVPNVFSSKALVLMDSVEFLDKMCPFMFQDAKLTRLVLYKRVFSFDLTNYAMNQRLNSSIRRLEFFNMYKLTLSQKFLHRHVFARLRHLTIACGSLFKIEPEVFKFLAEVNIISLINIRNFKGFLHSHGIQWMQ
jgi:hypothetical protein